MTGSEPAGAGAADPTAPAGGSARAAFLVGLGILASRLLGLVRQRAMAHFLGTSDATDAFTAAFRVPNAMQNLLGEGVLSAAFIPVYAGLRARGAEAGRREVAAAVLALLLLVTSVLVLIGVAAAPALVALTGPGFAGAKRDLTVTLIRVLFPGAAIFVLSAWCLGVLNSHGRFFLSYASAVLWNLAMIVTLLAFGGRRTDADLVVLLAWGSVAGSVLQFLVQVPVVRRVLGSLRPRWNAKAEEVRVIVRNFFPVFAGRGVAQVSAFVDSSIASFLGAGALATLGYAQALYMLPVSLFGMSVSAAELPAMSGATGDGEAVAALLRARLQTGLRRIAFFVVPSAAAFLALGDDIARLVYGSGRFGPAEARWVWAVLAGAAVGLLASTLGRLYSSVCYALRDTRTPLRFALVRVTVAAALAAALGLAAPALLHIDERWGVAGITVASGVAGWLEFALLRGAVARRLGPVGVEARTLLTLWGGAALAAGVGWGARLLNAGAPAIIRTGLVLALFAMTYWTFTWRAGVPEAVELRQRLFRTERRRHRRR